MGLESKAHGSESRLAAYVEAIASVLGHADRVVPFQSYCAGLLLPGDRKSVEPMAAHVQPGRVQAGIPDNIVFQTKPQIALDQLRDTIAAGIEATFVLADAGYGNDTDFRDGITEVGLPYAVGIQSTTTLWPPGIEPLPPKQWSGRGRPTSAIRRDAKHQPVSVRRLALDLPKKAWRRVTWREGTNTRLASRFAAVRVRPAHRAYQRPTPRPEEWCLIEWPADEPEPMKYFLSTLPATISRSALVDATKLRWRIERDYQDLKQELGLGHYEGRGWRGFHHHATLCIAAYGFLISERGAIPPSGPSNAVLIEEPTLSEGYRPRGSPNQA